MLHLLFICSYVKCMSVVPAFPHLPIVLAPLCLVPTAYVSVDGVADFDANCCCIRCCRCSRFRCCCSQRPHIWQANVFPSRFSCWYCENGATTFVWPTHTYAGLVALSSAVFLNVDVGVSVCVDVDVNVDAGVVATLHGDAFAALCAVTSLICQQHATHQSPSDNCNAPTPTPTTTTTHPLPTSPPPKLTRLPSKFEHDLMYAVVISLSRSYWPAFNHKHILSFFLSLPLFSSAFHTFSLSPYSPLSFCLAVYAIAMH